MKRVLLLLLAGLVFSCSDDVLIPEVITPCQPVATAFISDITDTSAQLNWCGSVNENGDCLPVTGVSWVASYGSPGFDPETGTLVSTGSTSAVVGGLTPQTSYEFYVKSDCDSGSNEWYGPIDFSTSCAAPTNLNVTNQTNTSATLTWSPGGNEVSWEIAYGLAGFNVEEAEVFATGNSMEYTVMNLQPSANYEFYVRANCNTTTDGDQIGSKSAFTGPYGFSTCLAPQNVTTTSAPNSITLDWEANGGSVWEVRYGPAAGFDPNTATSTFVNTPTFTATDVCPSNSYAFVVRANCGTVNSEWISTGAVFTSPLGFTGMYMYEEINNTDEPIFGDPTTVEIVNVSDTERSITVKYLANLDTGGTQPTMTFNFTLNCDGTVTVPEDQDTNFNCGGANVLLGQGTAAPLAYDPTDDDVINIRFAEDTGSATCTNAPMSEVTIRLTKI